MLKWRLSTLKKGLSKGAGMLREGGRENEGEGGRRGRKVCPAGGFGLNLCACVSEKAAG